MNEVAEASGIARATLYRYFPNREQLLQALVTVTLEETAARLDEADLDRVPVIEGIARMTRVVVAAGSKYAAVIGQPELAYCGDAKLRIRTLIEDLMRRGIEDGTLRGDLSVDELAFVFGRLLDGAARLAAERKAGVEHVAALITSVFLRGTERDGFVTGQAPARAGSS
jgi:AcrR family transcriptional regulator